MTRRICLTIALCASLSACAASGVHSASAGTITAADAAYTVYSAGLQEKIALSGVCADPTTTQCIAVKADFHAKDQNAYDALLAVRAGAATLDQLYAITSAKPVSGGN